MPTGYTSAICDGKITELQDYAISCARAFGACVTMRDSSANESIPERFEPSDYHLEKIDEAKSELKKFEAMSDWEGREYGIKKIKERIEDSKEYLEKNREENSRYQSMLEKVRAWECPQSHNEFKKFMVEQLEISMNNLEWSEERIEKAKKENALNEFKDATAKARHDIIYHEKEHDLEVERVEGRNKWLKDLRDSLGQQKGAE